MPGYVNTYTCMHSVNTYMNEYKHTNKQTCMLKQAWMHTHTQYTAIHANISELRQHLACISLVVSSGEGGGVC